MIGMIVEGFSIKIAIMHAILLSPVLAPFPFNGRNKLIDLHKAEF